MDMRREMGSQGALSRATFTRCENNDVHTSASRLTPGGKMNQRADSRKKNLELIVAKPLINEPRWLLSHTMRRSRGETESITPFRWSQCSTASQGAPLAA